MDDSMPEQKLRTDRYRIHYAFIFIGSLLLAEIYTRVTQTNMRGGAGIELALTHAVVLGLYFLIAFVCNLVKGYWRQLLSLLISLFLAFSIFVFQAWSGLDPDYLQFILMRPWYLAVVDRSGEGENAFYAWFWEEIRGGVISPTYTLLIYDSTDQIVRPPENRTTDWVDRVKRFASKGELELRDIADPTPYLIRPRRIVVDKLGNHFYFVTQL